MSDIAAWTGFFLGAKYHCKLGLHNDLALPRPSLNFEIRGCVDCGRIQVSLDEGNSWRDIELKTDDYVAYMEHQISMGPGRHACSCPLCQKVWPVIKRCV